MASLEPGAITFDAKLLVHRGLDDTLRSTDTRLAIKRPLPAGMARADGGARVGEGVMARNRGKPIPQPKPAAEVDFRDRGQAQAWFEHQSREVCIALAVRTALRVMPLIESARSRT